MTRYTRLVIGVAIGAATLLASALAFAQSGNSGGPPVSRRIEPMHRPAPGPIYRPAPPVYRPAPPVYRPAPYVHRPQPPIYRPQPPIYRPQPPVYRPPVYRPQPPIYRPRPVYPPHVYRPAPYYPVYPVAPPTIWQDYPGEPAYGCVWKKRKVWTVHGLRTKWRRICY